MLFNMTLFSYCNFEMILLLKKCSFFLGKSPNSEWTRLGRPQWLPEDSAPPWYAAPRLWNTWRQSLRQGVDPCNHVGLPIKAMKIKPQRSMCSLCPSKNLRLLILPSNYLFYVNCDDYSWLLTWLYLELTKTQIAVHTCTGFFFF